MPAGEARAGGCRLPARRPSTASAIPPEIEAKNDPRSRQSGITLPDDTVADLTQLARERPG
jgi:LDH2 family malate/lactate/ureidoglycolate dehydrogenase